MWLELVWTEGTISKSSLGFESFRDRLTLRHHVSLLLAVLCLWRPYCHWAEPMVTHFHSSSQLWDPLVLTGQHYPPQVRVRVYTPQGLQ